MKKSNLVIFLIFFSLLFVTIGYSSLSTSLLISGDVVFRPYKDLRITNFEKKEMNNAIESYDSSFATNDIKLGIKLNEVSATAVYTISITNLGNSKMQLKNIVLKNYSNEEIEYVLNGHHVGEICKPLEVKTFEITFKFKNNITTLPENNQLDAILSFVYEEYNPDYRYETDGLTIFLAGDSEPVNNEWIDKSGNGNAVLNNVTYDENRNAYYFSGTGSCALTNRSVIPLTGDYTVETMVRIEKIESTDESLIAQKRMVSTREVGRSKPMNLFYNKFRYWTSDSSSSDFSIPYSDNEVIIDGLYHLAVTKSGTTYKMYLDGQLVSVNTQRDFTISDGTTQIGCYSSVNDQNFQGWLYLVRIYNQALTDEQLASNYNVDMEIYTVNTTYDLQEYMLSHHVVTTGNGLYRISEQNRYTYSGASVPNYFQIGENLWRIISLEDNNLVKLISTNIGEPIAFDNSGNRNPIDSTYCKSSATAVSSGEYYGCHAFSKVDSFTTSSGTGNVANDSTVLTYLNTVFYNAMNEVEKSRLVKHDFFVGPTSLDSSYTNQQTYEEAREYIWNGYVGLLNSYDFRYASNNNFAIDEYTMANWIYTMASPNISFWTMNPVKNSNNDYDVNVVITNTSGSSIQQRRASRISQDSRNFYAPAVIYYDISNLNVVGSGNLTDPFVAQS